MFGYKEPQSDQGPTHLVGEELSYAAFEARWVARFWFCPLFGAMGFDGRFRVRRIAVKFFLQANVFDHTLDTSRADLQGVCLIFCAITSAVASGSRNRCRMT